MTWLISDLHGCARTLEKLLARIHAIDSEAQLVFLGDYGDRGPHSKEVVDIILGLPSEKLTLLRGNHCDVIDWLLNKHSFTNLQEYLYGDDPTDDYVISWWMINGLRATLESYGVTSHLVTGVYGGYKSIDVANEFRDKVPESHKQFYKTLVETWENETHFAVHAWADPTLTSPLDFPEGSSDPLWKRFKRRDTGEIAYMEPIWDKIGVFGHTPVSYYKAVAPIKMEKIRLIDCCAFDGQSLTGYCCESDDHISQITVDEDVWRKR